MTPSPAVRAVDKRSDPVTLPLPQKDLQTPLPAAGFPQSTPRSSPASVSTQPQPPARSTASTSLLEPWQWAVAVAAGAVFLYNASAVIALTLFLFSGYGSSVLTGRLLTSLVLVGLASFGVRWVLPDRKTILTFLVGGVSLRSLIRVLAIILTSQSLTVVFGWLIVGVASTAALWSIWKQNPRQAGDGSRLTLALTALIGAELTTIIYGFLVNPAYTRAPDLLAAVVVTGALVVLRLKLPAALGPEAAGPVAAGPVAAVGGISPGIDPRFRRVLIIVACIVIAVILRVLISAAFR